jgi:hypothetical protein
MQDLDLYCRSYGDQKHSFHLRVVRAAQKTSSNMFLKIKENCAMLDRSISKKEALVHSIPISEVKDMKSDVLRASLSKNKTLNLICRLNFNNFQERKISQTLNFFWQHFHHWDWKKIEIC